MTSHYSIPVVRLAVFGTILVTANSALHAEGPVRKFLNGDTTVTMLNSYHGSKTLPKPAQFIVCDFDIPSDVIALDKSLAQRAATDGIVAHIKGDAGRDESPKSVTADVNASFSKKLKKELKKVSLTENPTAGGIGADPSVGTLVIRGNFTTVKLGSKSERVIIGFGLGASDIKAHVDVVLYTENGPVLLAEFDLNSKSGKSPGAAVPMGPGSMAIGVATSEIGDRNATVEADASRMGKSVAKEIKKILNSRQWAPATAETSQAGALKASL